MSPQETLPGSGPIAMFFMPNVLGIFFALGLESISLEQRISNILPDHAHPYCLLGLGLFVIANATSFVSGRVVQARVKYNVKLPNLYANPATNKNAMIFNCIQRGHQNFIEMYGQVVLSVLFTALFANRPNVAGLILICVSIGRVFYAINYSNDIGSRLGPLFLAIFSNSVGVGYGFLIGVSAFGVKLLKD